MLQLTSNMWRPVYERMKSHLLAAAGRAIRKKPGITQAHPWLFDSTSQPSHTASGLPNLDRSNLYNQITSGLKIRLQAVHGASHHCLHEVRHRRKARARKQHSPRILRQNQEQKHNPHCASRQMGDIRQGLWPTWTLPMVESLSKRTSESGAQRHGRHGRRQPCVDASLHAGEPAARLTTREVIPHQ